MPKTEDPRQRILEILGQMIKMSEDNVWQKTPKTIWCEANSVSESSASFLESIRVFQYLLDDWRGQILVTNSSGSTEQYVYRVFVDLNLLPMNLGTFGFIR